MESASSEVKVTKNAGGDDSDTGSSGRAGHHRVVSDGNIGMPRAPIAGVSHRRIASVSVNGNGGEEERERWHSDYFGWVYHIGTNKIGHEYCHLRFMFIRGKYVEMYKRDPHENPGIIDCATVGEVQKWMEAFGRAKQQAKFELLRGGSARNKLNMETKIKLEGHRPRVRRYAHGLKRLKKIGQGPETLLRQSSNLGGNSTSDAYFEGEVGDAIETHEWKCVRTVNGSLRSPVTAIANCFLVLISTEICLNGPS